MKYRVRIPNNPEWINLLSAKGFEYLVDQPPFKALFLGHTDDGTGAILELDHGMVEFLAHIGPRQDGYTSPAIDGTPVIYLGDNGFALEPIPEPSPLEKAHYQVESTHGDTTIFFTDEIKSMVLDNDTLLMFHLGDGRQFYFPWANIERLMFFPEGFDPTCDHD